MIDELPAEILEKIFSYLDFRTLARCELVCKYWKPIAESNVLWRRHCADVWLVERNSEQNEGNCRETFVSQYREFGKYAACYKATRDAWNKIQHFVSERNVDIQFKPAMTDVQIDELERTMFSGQQLPEDLRCSLRIHEGESVRGANSADGLLEWFAVSTLLGEAHVYDTHCAESLVSVSQLQQLIGDVDCSFIYQAGYCPITLSLVVIHLGSSYSAKCVALRGNKHGVAPGSVVELSLMDPRIFDTAYKVNVLASSFADWFVKYAHELAAGFYPVYKRHVHAYRYDPQSVAHTLVGSPTSNSIVTVRVGTVHVPECYFTMRANYFGYNVQIEMNNDADERDECQLETRTWRIFDGDVEQNGVVAQPGVIGLYPRMRPGAKFNYSSCTLVKCDYGMMKGHFSFRKRDGSAVNVEVPEFHFRVPLSMQLIPATSAEVS